MNRLIGDLLDVSLIEAGQLGIERARVSTRQLLTDCAEAQRPLAASASLDLRLELADDLPDVWGDQHRLLQVLENLVGNAIKFTPVEGRITVGAAPRDGEVLFWVADTGCGISPDGLPHVFDRFWQARKGAHHGAGLGLPITRGIIEAHGGRIWVESTLGRGSVFFFTVPAAAEVAAQPSESWRSREPFLTLTLIALARRRRALPAQETGRRPRQLHPETTAEPDARFDADRSAVRLDDAFDGGEAKAQPGMRRVGATDVRLEDERFGSGREAGARVADLDAHPIAGVGGQDVDALSGPGVEVGDRVSHQVRQGGGEEAFVAGDQTVRGHGRFQTRARLVRHRAVFVDDLVHHGPNVAALAGTRGGRRRARNRTAPARCA